jgi:1,4-dihydroxy-2-naphthoate polyprenyltransferase
MTAGGTIGAWLLALRPKTLTAALVPVAVGTGLARATDGTTDGVVIACALGGAICIQIATNLFNDAIDFRKGTDTTERLGPTRVTQAGLISPRRVMIGGVMFLALATLCGVPLIVKGGWVVAVVGAASLLCAYAYTGGPVPLAYRGLGDLFVLIFFGLIAVSVTHFLHVGRFSPLALCAGVQSGAWAVTLLAVNNLRDVEGDAKSNKRTLPVRLGVAFGRAEVAVSVLVPFVLGSVWWLTDRPWAALLPLAALPLAAMVIRGVYAHDPGPIYNRFLARAAATQLVGGALLTIGLCL